MYVKPARGEHLECSKELFINTYKGINFSFCKTTNGCSFFSEKFYRSMPVFKLFVNDCQPVRRYFFNFLFLDLEINSH